MNRICRRFHGPRFTWFDWAGLELLSFENEWIRVVIWPAHGADILEFREKRHDIDVLWKSSRVWPPRIAPLNEPHSTRSEFYDVFHGGWFVSLPNGFFPGPWPDENGPSVGCHGEFQHLAWEVDVIACDDDQAVVRAIARGVRVPLRMERNWILRSDSRHLIWEERLVNDSDVDLPVVWLHHPMFGGPLLEGARIFSDAKQLAVPPATRPELSQLESGYTGPWPFAPQTRGGQRDCREVAAQNSETEHVICMSDFDAGWGVVWQEGRRLGFGLRWDSTFFPYLWSWTSGRGSSAYPLWGDCHTVTLQPSSSPLLSFPQLLDSHQTKILPARGTLQTRFTSGFVLDPEELAQDENC